MQRFFKACLAAVALGSAVDALTPKFHGSLNSLVHAHRNNLPLDHARSVMTFNHESVLCSVVPHRGESVQRLRRRLEQTEGVTVVAASKNWVDARINFAHLEAIHDWEEVAYVRAPHRPVTNIGSVTSQGVQSLRADVATSRFNVTGAGVRVGVISDSSNSVGGGLADSIASGDLPTNSELISEPDCTAISCTDEARALGEVVYDVANGVELFFATGFPSSAVMIQSIGDLADSGAQIIVDDLTFFDEPFFFDGSIANAALEFISNGGVYITSAGNRAKLSHEDTFRSDNVTDTHVFSSNGLTTEVFTLDFATSVGVVLQWDEEWRSLGGEGAETNLELIVSTTSATGSATCDSFDATGQDPLKFCVVSSTVAGDQFTLSVQRTSGDESPYFKILFTQTLVTLRRSFANAGTIIGHANTREIISVGAVDYRNTPAFGGTPVNEEFSSFGGVLLRRNAFTQEPLDEFKNTKKPDISGPDNADTSFFVAGQDPDNNGFPNFAGTSASAPHVAGVAALMLEGADFDDDETLTQFTVKRILRRTATRYTENVRQRGRGLVDAVRAVSRALARAN